MTGGTRRKARSTFLRARQGSGYTPAARSRKARYWAARESKTDAAVVVGGAEDFKDEKNSR